MPLGKNTKLLKTATEQAAADQLNAADDVLSGATRACWLDGHAVYSRVTLASNARYWWSRLKTRTGSIR